MAAEAKETLSFDDAKTRNIIRQIEFYFSDSNLPRDNFLRKTVEESQDGLVSLALICSFGRMKTILGLDNTTKAESVPDSAIEAVAEVLKSKSTTLRISDDGKRVGRIAEMLKPEVVIEQVDSRTIAASPLPYDVQLEDVESFFANHAKVNSVRLPRHADKRNITGTALIEFSEEEDAKKVLEEKLVFAGADLELKPKKDYDEEQEKVMKVMNDQEESYQKGLIISFKLTKKGFEKNKEAEKEDTVVATEKPSEGEAENEKAEVENEKLEGENEKMEVENEKVEGESEKVERENEKVEGEDSKEPQISREDVKAVFGKFGYIKYIDFAIGKEDGYIRYDKPEGAEKARAMAALSDDGLTVKNSIATVEAVTGEEEKKYWAELAKFRSENRFHRGGRGGGRHNNRGGRSSYGNKHGRRNDSGDKRPSKAQKVN